MSAKSYIEKSDLTHIIETQICKWCSNYNSGNFCNQCLICKVSLVYSCIALSTEHIFDSDSEVKYVDSDKTTKVEDNQCQK